ncbi:hypothetical protein BT63DRAFT_417824 [Microthyrium microscopicum]|uniref:Uncharacterized protein n=1 Tax=Microthyrium microscopicum TaxID=703497 RepID=A0A6A6TYQ8_9PEZI|nr:hypothetical protein BT63DRAFT_417824 [Microthyrium microscopicum]
MASNAFPEKFSDLFNEDAFYEALRQSRIINGTGQSFIQRIEKCLADIQAGIILKRWEQASQSADNLINEAQAIGARLLMIAAIDIRLYASMAREVQNVKKHMDERLGNLVCIEMQERVESDRAGKYGISVANERNLLQDRADQNNHSKVK